MEFTRTFEIFAQAGNQQEKPAFHNLKNGQWKSISWREYQDIANSLSAFLLNKGVRKGDRIVCLSENRPEWNFLDFGAMQIGAVHVPLPPTTSNSDLRYILDQLEPVAIFVSTKMMYKKVKSVLTEAEIQTTFSFDKTERTSGDDFFSIKPSEDKLEEIKKHAENVTPDDVVAIFYSSGTTGKPKGMKFSHRGWLEQLFRTIRETPIGNLQRAFSFLPLCYGFERWFNYIYQYYKIPIYYSNSPKLSLDLAQKVKPEILISVPVFLEKIYDNFITQPEAYNLTSGNWKDAQQKVLDISNNYLNQEKIDINTWSDHKVFHAFRQLFGGFLKYIVVSGAVLRQDVLHFFWAAKIPVYEMYGSSETLFISHNTPNGLLLGTVGSIIHQARLKLSDEGEILYHSPLLGFVKKSDRDPAKFNSENWYRTGDIGKLINGKYLSVMGRKADSFKTSDGIYVFPRPVEEQLKKSAFIKQVLLVGEFQPFVAALIIPDVEHLQKWVGELLQDIPDNEHQLFEKPAVKKLFDELVAQVNSREEESIHIEKYVLISDEWTIENGAFTSTMKPKRKTLQQRYENTIKNLYLKPSENAISSRKLKKNEQVSHFIFLLEQEFEEIETGRMLPNSKIREVLDWNSINVMFLAAFTKETYGSDLKPKELRSCETINDLFNLIKSKRNQNTIS